MAPPRANQLIEAGLWLRLSGDASGARKLFEEALKLDPGNARARQLSLSTGKAEPGAAPPAEPADSTGTVAPRVEPLGPLELQHAPASGLMPIPTSEDPGAEAPPESSRRITVRMRPPPRERPAAEPRPADPPTAWEAHSTPGLSVSSASAGLGAAMDLVVADDSHRPQAARAPAGAKSEAASLLRSARDLIGLDDHSGAIDLVNRALTLSPDDAEAGALRDRSQKTLEAMFESKMGRLESRPRVKLKDDEIIWLNLDHRAGFVLAQIDGSVTFEDLFSVSGMSRFDTARILAQLIDEGVISPGN